MKIINNIPQSCELFSGIKKEELSILLSELGTERRRFEKWETIYYAGEKIKAPGIVIYGRVQIENDDFWGNKSVLDSVGPGMVFAETYACVPHEPMLVNAVAAEPSEVLFVRVERLFSDKMEELPNGGRLIRNLLFIAARKNLHLSRRSIDTAPKTIRGRLLSYLSGQAAKIGAMEFTIPFDRQQLADYLNVDRSALSGELGKMRREGILETNRNHFILKKTMGEI